MVLKLDENDTVENIVNKVNEAGYPKAAKLIETTTKRSAQKGTTYGSPEFPVSNVANAIKMEIREKK